MSTKFHIGLALVLAGGVMSTGCVARAKVRATSGPGHTDAPPPEPVHRPPPPDHTAPPPPDRPAPRPRHVWDTAGWVLLGEQTVRGANDRDVITVGSQEGRFTHLMVVVDDGDLEMHDMVVTFGNGDSVSPPLKHYFRENDRSRAIDLPAPNAVNDRQRRIIKTIAFRYGNFAGDTARVQVWGKDVGRTDGGPAAKPVLKATWDKGGWTMLGSKVVKGKKENKDVLKVSKGAGPYTKLMLVVEDSELEVDSMVVTFGNKEKFEPEVKHMFREEDRTRAIDLPGEARNIKKIEFVYKNLPGGGKAKVEVWAKKE